MAEIVTEETWDELERDLSNTLTYYILSPDDGKVYIEFLSPLYMTKMGDEDLAGRIWEKEWAKFEAKVMVYKNDDFKLGESKCMSFAWRNSLIFRTFKARCLENNISPDDLPGTLWMFQKENNNSIDIKFLGWKKESKSKDKPKKKVEDNYSILLNILNDIKDEISDGIELDKFVNILAIKSRLNKSEILNLIPKLQENKIIAKHKDVVLVL